MTGGANQIHLSRRQPELPDTASCSGSLECALAGVADEVLIITWVGMLVVFALGTLVFLPKARDLCDQEQQCAQAEYDAFDEFLHRVNRVPTKQRSELVEVGGRGSLIQKQSSSNGNDLRSIQTAYRDTVMAVPHYDRDYDETIVEHMSAELSDELAYAVIGGNQFTPQLKSGVLEATREARERRKDFLALLDEESTSLDQHEHQLLRVDRTVTQATEPLCSDQSFERLRDRRETLVECERTIQQVIDQRQRDRTEGRTAFVQVKDGLDLQEYLYEPIDVTYPVLADATRILSQVDVGLRRVEDELIYRS